MAGIKVSDCDCSNGVFIFSPEFICDHLFKDEEFVTCDQFDPEDYDNVLLLYPALIGWHRKGKFLAQMEEAQYGNIDLNLISPN